MANFREFIEQAEFVDLVIREFDDAPVTGQNIGLQTAAAPIEKPWSAKKDEIIKIWKNVKTNLPITITPMDTSARDHSSYGEDGIRITGSWPFIASIIGRLKDIMSYENPQTKLRLVFRGVDASRNPRPDRQAYAFYVNLQKRGGKSGPELPPNTAPKPTMPKPGI